MHIYLFEAKKLQSFIFATGKLRDASGASELLNDIAFETGDERQSNDLLQRVLCEADLRDRSIITRRASGAIEVVFRDATKEAVQQFRALWRLAVMCHAPGIGFVDALAHSDEIDGKFEVDEEIDQRTRKYARKVLLAGMPPVAGLNLPLASPLVRLAALTGTPPVSQSHGEYVDAATQAKRRFETKDVLAKQFGGDDPKIRDLIWPRVLDVSEAEKGDDVYVMPLSEKHRVAVLHADGNGVGQIFIQAAKHLKPEQMRELSITLEKATKSATQQAAVATLADFAENDILPARPVILGGDDLTLVVRSDRALPFVRAYLENFERETVAVVDFLRHACKEGSKKDKSFIPEKNLTAKAGIAFIGRRQPFSRAYELCEALASEARSATASRVSFWRVVSSQFERSTEEIRARTVSETVRLWRPSWSLNKLGDLQVLVKAMQHEAVGRGALRRIPELLDTNPDEAARVYQRAFGIVKNQNSDAYTALLHALAPFGMDETSLPYAAYDDDTQYCPLLDAHALSQLM